MSLISKSVVLLWEDTAAAVAKRSRLSRVEFIAPHVMSSSQRFRIPLEKHKLRQINLMNWPSHDY